MVPRLGVMRAESGRPHGTADAIAEDVCANIGDKNYEKGEITCSLTKPQASALR
jgi:hypothetical protein